MQFFQYSTRGWASKRLVGVESCNKILKCNCLIHVYVLFELSEIMIFTLIAIRPCPFFYHLIFIAFCLYLPSEFSIKFDTVKLVWSIVYICILRGQR